MYTYSCGTPAFQTTTCANTGGGFGGGFAFILVLFILLAIICSTPFVGGFGGCCEEREPRCFG